ncbi:MAG: 4-(cytidine 5'-diphospho)-2-C-methyl-D-erythritol kinase [Puniceicoccales bacterium]|jgi:4-diphosphocytidyl-2-C-methyl-D-erythritol kinase|nr:4-(cytidine 5'-diphospho)-2-C-methyl-D-erythritol kinase [Puniceicoccales bacterium]
MGLFRRIECPAKLNLCLYVQGKRDDSFHDIASLAVQVDFCDRMAIRFSDEASDDMMFCDIPDIPTNYKNIIMKALRMFRDVYDFPYRISVSLEKNIPIGSGLGGGSSNAAYFLKLLNEMLAFPLSRDELFAVAARVGSDVPLFLSSSPCIVKGRGDVVLSVASQRLAGLRAIKFLIFKPIFSIATEEAYEILDVSSAVYFSSGEFTSRNIQQMLLQLENGVPAFHNVFQPLIGGKYLELGVIFRDLVNYFKARAYLTGTGSACFVPLPTNYGTKPMVEYLHEVLGESAFIVETKARTFDQ